MSDHKKCDRCGEYYAKDINYRKLGKLYDTGGATKDQWDLCPDCWESFDSWIANDGSAPKNGVSGECVDANDADAASVSFSSVTETENADSRAKLETDAFNLIAQMVNEAYSMGEREATWTVNRASVHERIASWLDRQAAITEEEARCKWVVATADEIARLRDENMNLARDLGECMADRDRYRALCGQMLDAAHEIRRIADANMPEVAKEVLK